MPGIANTLAEDLIYAVTDIVQLQAGDMLPVARAGEQAPHSTTPDEISTYVGANLASFEKSLTLVGLDVDANKIRIRSAKTPTTASSAGNAGEICWDATYLYICVDTNTWKRVAIDTWA